MSYIGKVNATDWANSGIIATNITFDGRFVAPDFGSVFLDFLLHKETDIVIPALTGYKAVNAGGYSNNAFINLVRQEYLIFLWEVSTATSLLAMFDFTGHLKYKVRFIPPSNWAPLYSGICFFNNQYHFTCQDVATTKLNYFVLETSTGTPSLTLQNKRAIATNYSVFSTGKGITLFTQNPPEPIVSSYIGESGYFGQYNNASGLGSVFTLEHATARIFNGRFVCQTTNDVKNITIPANGLVTAANNNGTPLLMFGDQTFDLQFPSAHAGEIIYGSLFGKGSVFYALTSLARLFCSVYYPRFSHNFSDNFARGVPIAGVKRA